MGTVASTLRNICCCCRVSEKKDNSKFPRSPGRENPQLPNILKGEYGALWSSWHCSLK